MTKFLFILMAGCSFFSEVKPCASDNDCASGQVCIGGSYGGQGVCTGNTIASVNDYDFNKKNMLPGTEYKQRFQHQHNGKWYDCWTVLPMAKIGPTIPGTDKAIGPEYMEGSECEDWKRDSGKCEM